MKIVFATNNKNKLAEIKEILGENFEVLSLNDINCHVDIPETGTTLEENAKIKAEYIYNHYGISVFADDTGLEVDALNGAPGVYSARYAGGEGHDSEANMRKLLHELEDKENRKARFRTVIAYISAEGPHPNTDKKQDPNITNKTEEAEALLFEGICTGDIIKEKRGETGFGYDPIFQPTGYDKTFAELGHEIKNKISHRALAVEKFANYLKSKV